MKKLSILSIVLILLLNSFISIIASQANAETGEGPKLHYMEFGEYPRSFVGSALNTLLEDGYDAQTEKLFGQSAVGYYSANKAQITSEKYKEELIPAFIYQAEKYVRVISLRHADSFGTSVGSSAVFSDGTPQAESGTIYWFKVEPIQWIILNWEKLPARLNPEGDGTATAVEIVAKEALAVNIPFSKDNVSIWEYSTIRGWLNGIDITNQEQPIEGGDFSAGGIYNGNFISDAFTADERAVILDTTNNTNGLSDTLSGSTQSHNKIITTEKIYLLSWTEVFETYQNVFGDRIATADDERRVCQTTDYGKANNARVSDNINGALIQGSTYERYKGNIWWWLRTNWGDGGTGAFVNYAGFQNSQRAENINNGIRPAMRLKLEDTYSVTLTATGNGTVSSDSHVESAGRIIQAKEGDNRTINFMAETGYHISKIIINDIELTGQSFSSAKANGCYIIKNITADMIFNVEFEKDAMQFAVKIITDGKGSVDQKGEVLVTEGDKLTIHFAAETGYHISKIIINDTELTGQAFNDAKANGCYVIENITADMTFSVEFEKNTVFSWWWVIAGIILLSILITVIILINKKTQNKDDMVRL